MDKTTALDKVFSVWAARQALDEREWQAVKTARLTGATWEEIADSLGVTRQAAHERFTRQGLA